MQDVKKHAKKIVVGIVGGLVLIVGIVAIPYPGPGWLIVFAGLAILATEFEWAQRLLVFARGKYDTWTDWLKRQNRLVQLTVLGVTGIVIVLTIWLLNGFGMLNALFHLPFEWVKSPLF
ncbi:MAG TPA: TIGR02611 family protein [Candidatus Saccharimonadales bacterium]|nr:TIGR02611 family protein [Candidatus Saccharimonadales bacterium]